MSRYYYNINQEQSFTIRGTAKLLNVASSRYGGDWHSTPHAHSYTELFYIIGADTLMELKLWREYGRVLELSRFLVCPRPSRYSQDELSFRRKNALISHGLSDSELEDYLKTL